MQADAPTAAPQSTPGYGLRVWYRGPADVEYEIWRLPNAATPHLIAATRVAGLRGANLNLVEHRVLATLRVLLTEPRNGPARSPVRTWQNSP